MKKFFQTFQRLFRKKATEEDIESDLDEDDDLAASLEFKVHRDGDTYISCAFGEDEDDITTFCTLFNQVHSGLLKTDTLDIILNTCKEQNQPDVYIAIISILQQLSKEVSNTPLVRPTEAIQQSNSEIFPNSL